MRGDYQLNINTSNDTDFFSNIPNKQIFSYYNVFVCGERRNRVSFISSFILNFYYYGRVDFSLLSRFSNDSPVRDLDSPNLYNSLYSDIF